MTVAKGQRGDAGARFDLAPNTRPGVGPVSSKRWGDGGRKKGEDRQPVLTYSIKPCPESAEHWLGRAPVICAGESTFRSLRQTGVNASLPGFQGVVFKGELKARQSGANGEPRLDARKQLQPSSGLRTPNPGFCMTWV